MARRLVSCLLFLWLGACAAAVEPATTEPPAATTTQPPATTTTRPPSGSASGEFHMPGGVSDPPLVVLIPGGAWRTADPAGLSDLAAALAEAGIASMTTSVRAAEDRVFYPAPVEDVVCAVSQAVAEMTASGSPPAKVVLFGHSTGAHLATLAALAPDRYAATCDFPMTPVDALIGVAGTYDVRDVADIAVDLFGATEAEAPAAWAEGNAVEAASLRPEVPVLLIHGDADDLVPMSFTDDFADALRAGGHAVTLSVVAGGDHHAVYRPENVAATIIDWVQGL